MAKLNNEISPQVINLIAKGTKIKGDIITEGDIRIDGILIGKLDCKGRLVVGETGSIEGEITCKSSEIAGQVKGKLFIAELLSLKASSKVLGDIISGKLSIEPGAFFSGSCSMGDEQKRNEQKQVQ